MTIIITSKKEKQPRKKNNKTNFKNNQSNNQSNKQQKQIEEENLKFIPEILKRIINLVQSLQSIDIEL